ncbi:Uncharacterized protein DBV15_09706 [Temnothorax longispinosus]|uniref:alkaline phosphatase n=1 Tax=Temnothorax longispinosus TaxID=300112 RepID=A0A4S2LCI3_9HYME|nr:Uncharacterized protein DBV15_09706 [Temnothorax longispinosus]
MGKSSKPEKYFDNEVLNQLNLQRCLRQQQAAGVIHSYNSFRLIIEPALLLPMKPALQPSLRDLIFILRRSFQREVWYEAATRAIETRIREAASSSVSGTTPPAGVARGVVLFVGDGMGMSTLTAARILAGQRHGNPGEETQLAWESFPAVALARTF